MPRFIPIKDSSKAMSFPLGLRVSSWTWQGHKGEMGPISGATGAVLPHSSPPRQVNFSMCLWVGMVPQLIVVEVALGVGMGEQPQRVTLVKELVEEPLISVLPLRISPPDWLWQEGAEDVETRLSEALVVGLSLEMVVLTDVARQLEEVHRPREAWG